MVYIRTVGNAQQAENLRQEMILWNVIRENPNVNQNGLIDIVGTLEADYRLSHETIRKALRRLLWRGMLYRVKVGNKSCYTCRDVNTRKLQLALNKAIEELELVGRAIMRDFESFSNLKKNTVLMNFIQALRDMQGIITHLANSADYFDVHKEQEKVNRLVKDAYKIVNHSKQPLWHFPFTILSHDFNIRFIQLKDFFSKEEKDYSTAL